MLSAYILNIESDVLCIAIDTYISYLIHLFIDSCHHLYVGEETYATDSVAGYRR